jgi:hypothetical protein
MPLSAEDRLAIHELLNLHGHVCDAGAFERFEEIFTADVVYDVTDLGGGTMRGLDECRDASIALGGGNPVGHHVTNVVVEAGGSSDGVDVVSKGLGLRADGTLGSVVYRDRVVRRPEGWRIAHRTVLGRREPLTPYELPASSA